ncbi:hypothetical protein JCM11251_007595 [Rhodosporidiobolus azoricus]
MASNDTRTAVTAAAAASIATAAAAYALHRLAFAPAQSARSSPTSEPTSTSLDSRNKSSDDQEESDNKKKKKGKGSAAGDGKRYDTVREYYSTGTGRWETLTENDSDSDSDAEGDEEKKRKRRMLFTAKQRTWPKSPEYSGYEDYIALTLRSSALIQLLRDDITGLRECEEVFEDKPSVDAKDLFLVVKELRKVLGAKEEEATKMKGEGEDVEKKDKEEEKKVEEELDEHDDHATAAKVVPPPKKTKEELEEEVDHLKVLIGYIDELFEPTQAKLLRLLHPPPSASSSTSTTSDEPAFHPQISFPLLWAIFTPNSLAVGEHEVSGEKYGFRVKSASYNMGRDGMQFVLSGTTLSWNGSKYVRSWVDERILKFKSLRRLSSLPITPLVPGSKLHDELTARGKLYTGLTGDPVREGEGGVGADGVRFLQYEGVLAIVTGGGMDRKIVKLRAEGRAVIDIKSYRRMNPGRAASQFWDDDDDDDDPFLYGDPSLPMHPTHDSTSDASSVAPNELCLLPPTVYGFSLSLREWGELLVTGFSKINFRKDAWDRLVLERETKEMVKGLVEFNGAVRKARSRQGAAGKEGEKAGEVEEREVVQDFVEGKGGGLVIALHGTPGTGKTLTAEAVAESLQVPLYSVGAGSLGVQADVLEKRLRDVLDIAQQWGATLLIDEADVFLEARSLHDVQRNSMVSVFLRLLEFHSGVLFLTTNRIRAIDEAFLSRFSLAITYPNLDKAKRKVIWRSFLELAGVGISSSTSARYDDDSDSEDYGQARNEVSPNGTTGGGEKKFDHFVSAKYLDQLASHAGFNGRQIKNIVRTAQSLALSQNLPLSAKQIDVVVKASQAFQEDFENSDEKGVYEAAGEGWKDRTNIFN